MHLSYITATPKSIDGYGTRTERRSIELKEILPLGRLC